MASRSIKIAVKPELVIWARERAGMSQEDLTIKFKSLPKWEHGELLPTLKQLEKFARAVHVPLGYLFLAEPPVETPSIPDFRTVASKQRTHYSPNLLDALRHCLERQDWYRDFAMAIQQPACNFIGSLRLSTPPKHAAESIRLEIGFDPAARKKSRDNSGALKRFVSEVDRVGVLVMVSSIVQSDTHRNLDIEEFRGFALADPLAPLIFINAADSKAGQIFTLAHELAHLYLNVSGLSDAKPHHQPDHKSQEAWCNKVATELLVPLDDFCAELTSDEPVDDAVERLSHLFKVSESVVLLRMLDANFIAKDKFRLRWSACREHAKETSIRAGGNFYRSTLSRVSNRFASALITSTLEGQTLYRDAARMLGVSKISSINKLRP